MAVTFDAVFEDRRSAGRAMVNALAHHRSEPNTVVLGLPRGGVPVAYEVATAIGAPMDVFVVRKVGVPTHPELAMGAIASNGAMVVNDDVVSAFHLTPDQVQAAAARERGEVERREAAYRAGRTLLDVGGKSVIMVDDGLATGSTMLAAVSAVRELDPARVTVAVPVASRSAYRRVQAEVDEMVCARLPERFFAVGQWYRDFEQTTDHEVRRLLASARTAAASSGRLLDP